MHSAPKVKDLKDAETNLELVHSFKYPVYQFAPIYDSVITRAHMTFSTNFQRNSHNWKFRMVDRCNFFFFFFFFFTDKKTRVGRLTQGW